MAYNIFIFVPAFGQQISATTFLTSHALQQALGAKGIGGGVSTLSFPDIAELRSMALTIWYDAMPHCSHLLFVDADMGFPPDLVLDMLMLDEPLVGTIYRQRKPQVSWAGSGTGSATTERRAGFMLVEGVGMGCTLIRRDLVTVMLEKMPELVDNRLHLHPAGDTLRGAGASRMIRAFEKLDIPDRGIVSEDLSFCIRWGKCGGKVWGAIGHNVNHVGPYDYSGRYLDMVEKPEMFQGQDQGNVMPVQKPPAGVVPIPPAVLAKSNGSAMPEGLTDQAAKFLEAVSNNGGGTLDQKIQAMAEQYALGTSAATGMFKPIVPPLLTAAAE